MGDHKTTAVSYAASGATAVFGIASATEMAAYGGLLFAALTFVVNTWFKYKHFKLAEAAQKAGRASLLDQGG